MDFRRQIVTCLFSMLRLSFETQKVKENYAIFLFKHPDVLGQYTRVFWVKTSPCIGVKHPDVLTSQSYTL